MKIETIPSGAFATNCYILEDQGTVLVMDPTGKAQRILDRLQGRVPLAIILTHGHFDHIGAVDELVRQFHCPVYVHPEDQILLEDETLNSMAQMTAHVRSQTRPLIEGTMKLGTIEFQVIEAPGPTPGSVMIVIGQDCFCGDVIFEGSIGRTDLPLGNDSQMRQTLKMIRTLNPQLRLYPGHGAASVLEKELMNNPFLRTHRS
ncbi:MAG: MBL fold metallo-hydrolase [Holdemania massiliensis]